jgi:hypothetical protein
MEEIIIYRANDGTDFDYEYDCQFYEWQCSVRDEQSPQVVLMDVNYKRLPLDHTDSYTDVYYIFIGDEKSARFLYDIWDCDMVGTYRPDFLCGYKIKTGLYAYDVENEKWYHLGDKLEEIQREADRCMRTVNEWFGGI